MIGLSHYLTVAAILFTLGVLGIFINRKNIIVILMSVELILLAVNINLVAFSTHLGDIVGQVFALFVLTVAAAEGRDRPRHPGGVLPQPRVDRRRGRQHDEGLTRLTEPARPFPQEPAPQRQPPREAGTRACTTRSSSCP